jgi:hypothetical protein
VSRADHNHVEGLVEIHHLFSYAKGRKYLC